MRLRKTIIVLTSCVCLSFNAYASDYELIAHDYGIEDEYDLEEALSMYQIIKDYNITRHDDLDDALYTYLYFDDAVNNKYHLSEIQGKVLENIKSDTYDDAYNDGKIDMLGKIVMCTYFAVFVLIVGKIIQLFK